VLIDSKEDECFIGRTYKDAPEVDQEVYVSNDKKIKTGEFCDVKIFDFEEFDLFGEVIK
jgi:ribosomal protein S12 methylthiotransferase